MAVSHVNIIAENYITPVSILKYSDGLLFHFRACGLLRFNLFCDSKQIFNKSFKLLNCQVFTYAIL